MHQTHILQKACDKIVYCRVQKASEVNAVDALSKKRQWTHPGHLVCEASFSCQHGMSSYSVLVLLRLGSNLRLVSHQLGSALSGDVAALLLWETLPVVAPLLQGLVKGGVTHQG